MDSSAQYQLKMPSEAPGRLSVTELIRDDTFVTRAASKAGVSRSELRELIARANERLLAELNLEDPPLQLVGGALRANGVVGLLRLSPRLELEIAPKYLGADAVNWREDFFFIAQMSRFGRLLASERLGTRATGRKGLANLMAGALVELYWESFRRPLRTYRTVQVDDFDLVGEFDVEDLLFPTPNGFSQRITNLTRANQYNGVIREAARRLVLEVDDSEMRRRLVRVIEHLSPQSSESGRRPVRVPSRHQRWQPLYDLSSQVVDGFGLDLNGGHLSIAPGFVLRAAKSWEDLVSHATRFGLSDASVRPQWGHVLGKRDGQAFNTTPDVTVDFGLDRVLMDAKYKGRANTPQMAVSASDVYEGLAFLRAANSKVLLLFYPRRHDPNSSPQEVGTVSQFEHIEVDELHIYAYEIEARGISRKSGYRLFASNIGNAVRDARNFIPAPSS
jgi:5-methylcytosine-specific restriction enzyme subunit McrC